MACAAGLPEPELKRFTTIDLSGIVRDMPMRPKCPNCKQDWAVEARRDGRFECHSPVCLRTDERGRERRFVFAEGEVRKPPPRRGEWKMLDREPSAYRRR